MLLLDLRGNPLSTDAYTVHIPQIRADNPDLILYVDSIPGDIDGNGRVNSGDLDVIRSNWGQAVTGVENGDANGDGVVGSADLDVVRANWGMSVAPASIPEPPSIICLLALCLLPGTRRRLR